MLKSTPISIIILILSSIIEISTVQGCVRYDSYSWAEVPDKVKEAAAVVGYDEMSWEEPGTNPLDDLRFSDLPLMDSVLDLEALETLDVYDGTLENPGLCWDHFVNHYAGYYWDDLADTKHPFGDNLLEAAQVLGWTKDMWDETEAGQDQVPDSECKGWMELTPDERWALRAFGWTALRWMSYPMDPRCPEEFFTLPEEDGM